MLRFARAAALPTGAGDLEDTPFGNSSVPQTTSTPGIATTIMLGFHNFYEERILLCSHLFAWCFAVFVIFPKLPFKLAQLSFWIVFLTAVHVLFFVVFSSLKVWQRVLGRPDRCPWATIYQKCTEARRRRWDKYFRLPAAESHNGRLAGIRKLIGGVKEWYGPLEKHDKFWMLLRFQWGKICFLWYTESQRQAKQRLEA
ncbi:hypothetical protein NMY22_g15716 [Coprinellus aureogranulatus]|nr:hypothetical protein NMY22_g15716 [Coprinellus aureogranulatus]